MFTGARFIQVNLRELRVSEIYDGLCPEPGWVGHCGFAVAKASGCSLKVRVEIVEWWNGS